MDAISARAARIVRERDSDPVGRAHIRIEPSRRVGFPPSSVSEAGCYESIVFSTGCDVVDLRSILFQGAIDIIVRRLHGFERAIPAYAVVDDRERPSAGQDATHHLRIRLADMLAKRMPTAHLFFGEHDRVPAVGVIRDINDPRIVVGIMPVARIAIRSLAAVRVPGRHAGLVGVIRTQRQAQPQEGDLLAVRSDQPSRPLEARRAWRHGMHPSDLTIFLSGNNFRTARGLSKPSNAKRRSLGEAPALRHGQ